MKIFVLIDEQDTDAACGCNVKSFLDMDEARTSMQQAFKNALDDWEFDLSFDTEEHYAECNDKDAVIRAGFDVESWRIEEQELAVQVAVEVKNGLVQNIYANADVNATVYDLDVSHFPDDGEEDEAYRKRVGLNALVKTPGWRNVY